MRIATLEPKAPVSHSFKPGQPLDKLDEMLGKGEIASYVQEGDHISVQTNPSTDAAKLDQALTQPASLPYLAKASQLFVPPDIKENCAPEYLRFRLALLGAPDAAGLRKLLKDSPLL